MKHAMGLLLGCVFMLLLIVILPALGVGLGRSGVAGVLIAACIAAHLLLMRGHGSGGGNKNDKDNEH